LALRSGLTLNKITYITGVILILISCTESQSLKSESVLKEDNIFLISAVSFEESYVIIIKKDFEKQPDIVYLYILDSNLKILDKRNYRSTSSNIPLGISEKYVVCDIFGSIGTIIYNSTTNEIIEAEVPFPALGKIHINGDYAYADGAGKSAPAVLDLKTGEMFRNKSIPFCAGTISIEGDHIYIYSHPGWVDEDTAIELFNDATYKEVPYEIIKANAARAAESEWNPKVTNTTIEIQKILGIPIYKY